MLQLGRRAASVTPVGIREAATRAVGLIQTSQKDWYIKQSCGSCHQQLLPALAFRDAREHGIPVEEAPAHADAIKSFGYYANLDRAVQYTHIIDPAMDEGYHLLAANAVGVRPSLVTALYARHIARSSEAGWPLGYGRYSSTAIV